MKKIAAIFFFVIYTCSTVSFPLLCTFMERASDAYANAAIDNGNYSNAALIEIAVPLNMPYINNQSDYERCTGSIQIEGKQYNYIKRKISNDTLHLVCLPNITKTGLSRLKTDVAKQLSDTPAGKDNAQNTAKKSTIGYEYNNHFTEYCINSFTDNLPKEPSYNFSTLKDCFIEFQGKPPRTNI